METACGGDSEMRRDHGATEQVSCHFVAELDCTFGLFFTVRRPSTKYELSCHKHVVSLSLCLTEGKIYRNAAHL